MANFYSKMERQTIAERQGIPCKLSFSGISDSWFLAKQIVDCQKYSTFFDNRTLFFAKQKSKYCKII